MTPFSRWEELNRRFYAVVRRLHELEQLRMDWQAAVSEVQNHGLARINEAVSPLVDGLRADMEELIAQGQAAQAAFTSQGQAALASQQAAVAAMLATHGGQDRPGGRFAGRGWA